jgi:hypothetical protein
MTASATVQRAIDVPGINALPPMVRNASAIANAPANNGESIENDTTAQSESPEIHDISEGQVTELVRVSRDLRPNSDLSSDEVEHVFKEVDAAFAEGLQEMTNAVFMEIVLQTYTFEEVILEAAKEAGMQPEEASRGDNRGSTLRTDSERSSQQQHQPTQQQQQQQFLSPNDAAFLDKPAWSVLTFPSGRKSKVPYTSIMTVKVSVPSQVRWPRSNFPQQQLLFTVFSIDVDAGDGFLQAAERRFNVSLYVDDS